MGLVALIIAFEYTCFFVMQCVFGIDQGGTGLRVFSIVFFALCLREFLFCTERRQKDWWFMIVIAAFLGLFVTTRAKFGHTNEDYEGMLLSFGVRCVPAVIAGVLVAKNDEYFAKMQKWIQVLMLFYTIGVAMAVFSSSNSEYIQFKFSTGGVNYQTLSYCSAFAFNMNLYVILNWDKIGKFRMFDNNFWKTVNIFLLAFQIYCMFSGGGRGAVGNVIIVAMFLMYVKMGCKYNVKFLFFAIFFAIAVFTIIFAVANRTGNVGAVRLMEFFTDSNSLFDNERTALQEIAMKVFVNNPIFGHGIGSIFYTMTGYSHNIFTDIMVEGGIVMLGIALFIVGSSFVNTKAVVMRSNNNTLVYMIFWSSFSMLLFSGYYLADGGLWFAISYLMYTISDMRDEKQELERQQRLQGVRQ